MMHVWQSEVEVTDGSCATIELPRAGLENDGPLQSRNFSVGSR